MSPLELICVVLSLCSYYQLVKRKWYGFVISIVNYILWTILLMNPAVYLTQAFYTVIAIKGIYEWRFKQEDEVKRKVRKHGESDA